MRRGACIGSLLGPEPDGAMLRPAWPIRRNEPQPTRTSATCPRTRWGSWCSVCSMRTRAPSRHGIECARWRVGASFSSGARWAWRMDQFEHERLDVYRTRIEFLALSDQMASALPRGRTYLADQHRRAASSIPLNIAEGAGEFAAADRARFYRFARRSATESAAIIDALAALELTDESLRTWPRPTAPHRRHAHRHGLEDFGLGLGLGLGAPLKTLLGVTPTPALGDGPRHWRRPCPDCGGTPHARTAPRVPSNLRHPRRIRGPPHSLTPNWTPGHSTVKMLLGCWTTCCARGIWTTCRTR